MGRKTGVTRAKSILFVLLAAGCGDKTEQMMQPPPSFPQIEVFEADRMVISEGEAVVLRYRVSSADTVSISPNILVEDARLEAEVNTGPLAETTVYTLVARSEFGTTERSLVITVGFVDDVRIVEFTADPPIVAPGSPATLRWATENAVQVQLSVEGGGVLQPMAELTGQAQVQPDADTVYILTALGGKSPVEARVQVLVGVQPQVRSFVANPSQITGGSSTLEWEATGAETVTLRTMDGQVLVENAPLVGTHSVSPAMTTSYMLVATNSVGSDVQSATVEVLPPGSPRILTFTVTPQTLPGPGSVTITWSTADADVIDLRADGMSVQTFPRTPSGMIDLPLTQTTVLELRAENDQETSTDAVTVTVGTPDTAPPQIQHNPVADGQAEGSDVTVFATITDADSGVDSATLFYRQQGAASFSSVAMADQGNDRFQAQIPAVAPAGVEYYIFAADAAATPNNASEPAGAPANLHAFTVAPDDQAPPVVMHTPIAADQIEASAVMISAQITDMSGLSSVQLFYKPQSQALYTSVQMNGSGDTYTAQIPAGSVVPPGVDYYLEAVDAAMPGNQARAPATAPTTPHAFSVTALDLTSPAIAHTPIAGGQQAGSAVTVSADVTDTTGVAGVTLYYRAQGGGAFTSMIMSGAGPTRTAQIPGAAVSVPGVEYYIEASDTAVPANVGTVPASAPGLPYGFTVTPVDNAPPTISHTPVQDGIAPGQALTVSADVVDASGVAIVDLFYRTQGAPMFSQVSMNGAGSYTAQIPAAAVQAPGVEYYVRAADASPAGNSATLPATAPQVVFSASTGGLEMEPNNSAAQASLLLGPGQLTNIGLGALSNNADRDFWIIDVPMGAERYTVSVEATSGGVGLCPSGDTFLTLFASDGTTVLVADDSDGTNGCSFLNPVADTGMRALAPGRYYLAIEEDGNNNTFGSYELRASMTPAACGNGLLETGAGEQCDDSNTNAADGCSPSCAWETVGSFTAPGAALPGAITPAGDADFFMVTIGQGQFLSAFTSDGGAGCPGDTVLELYGADGVTQLGGDDDDGTSNCSRIDPNTDGWAANMAAGTYFLRVRAFSINATIPNYTLTVSITDNLCGNGALEGTETCDDGNAADFDGCSAQCQYELEGTAMGAGASFSGALNPAGNIDWFAVVVPQGYSVRAETFAPTDGQCLAGNDTVIRLWQSDRTTEIIEDDDGGSSRCSLIDPQNDVAARDLAAGTYYLSVEDYNNNDTISAYVLNVAIQAPVCGDAIISGAEQCDDGNTAASDGCDASCQYEGNAEAEPNNDIASATALLTAGTFNAQVVGSLQLATDSDFYSIEVPAGAHVFAEIAGTDGGCPVDTTLRLRTAAGTSLVSDNADGPGSCGRVSPGADSGARDLAAGTYYLEVDNGGSLDTSAYVLTVRVLTPGCGDMYLEMTEACDDGNTMDGDGCSAMCTFEQAEAEPNDTAMAPQAVTGAIRMIDGSINAAGDEDWFAVTVPQNARLSASTHSGGLDQCNGDSVLDIFDPTGMTSLANDDLDGPGSCSKIDPDEAGGLAAGTYLIRVRAFNGTATFNYALSFEIR